MPRKGSFRSVRAVLGALTLALWLAVPAGAAAGNTDGEEISAYRLTEEGLTRYIRATENLLALAEDERDRLRRRADQTAETLGEQQALYESVAGASSAIRSAGMTTREYLVFSWSMAQAAIASWALSQPGAKLPSGVSMDNVSFYRKHEAALETLRARSQRLGLLEDGDGPDGDGPPEEEEELADRQGDEGE